MDEKIQCQFHIQTNTTPERCQKPYTNLYEVKDGHNIKVCDDHLIKVLEYIESNIPLSGII